MKNLTLDIFLNERFYGTLRIPNRWGGGIRANRRRTVRHRHRTTAAINKQEL